MPAPVYRKPPDSVACVMSGFVTTTFTRPAACTPVVAVIVSVFRTVTDVAAVPPIVTVAPSRKYAPEIVTAVPPPDEPVAGPIALTAIAPR